MYVIVITDAYCCNRCFGQEERWMPREVRGPFKSIKEAALCLKELRFHGKHETPLNLQDLPRAPDGSPGILWRKRDGVWRNAVVCPLTP